MVTPLEMEKRNLECSLLFIQQEHSVTLKALHEEISKIQKKCKELTFELTVQNFSADETDQAGMENRVTELEGLLQENISKYSEMEVDIQKKDKIISHLKRELKKTEKSFVEELKMKDQQVQTLKLELDNKSSTIAYLTTEMHRYKVLRHSSNKELAEPPKSPASVDHKQRTHRISSAEILSRPVSAKGSMRRSDAQVFLESNATLDTGSETVAVKPTPPVLPPITGSDEANRKVLSRRQQLIRRRVDVKVQPEYSKLAVEKVASNNTWVTEPNTTTK